VRLSYILAAILSHTHLLSHSFSIPELLKTKGQVVIISSGAAQHRIPNASEYCTSKLAINRFAEFIALGEAHFKEAFLSKISTEHQILIALQNIPTSGSSPFIRVLSRLICLTSSVVYLHLTPL
jgi:hypothetical protein